MENPYPMLDLIFSRICMPSQTAIPPAAESPRRRATAAYRPSDLGIAVARSLGGGGGHSEHFSDNRAAKSRLLSTALDLSVCSASDSSCARISPALFAAAMSSSDRIGAAVWNGYAGATCSCRTRGFGPDAKRCLRRLRTLWENRMDWFFMAGEEDGSAGICFDPGR